MLTETPSDDVTGKKTDKVLSWSYPDSNKRKTMPISGNQPNKMLDDCLENPVSESLQKCQLCTTHYFIISDGKYFW